MKVSEATLQATRNEWRVLGFYYETRDRPPCWRLIGSPTGLEKFVQLLDQYVRDARNELLSEHEHHGPYMYLKVQTSEAPEIDDRSIRGTLEDLARLRDLVSARLRSAHPGQVFSIGREYSTHVRFPLQFEVREPDFDPASADPQLRTSRS
jgi:hypothetical protein